MTTITDFEKGNTVYTKDGQKWYLDHIAGEYAMVSPYIIIQTMTYDQQDFTEDEDVAGHMVPVRLSDISKEPWTRVIHQETTDAILEKTAALADLDCQIGAARREARHAEEVLEKRKREVEEEARILERRFQWVRDFRRMIGEEELFMMAARDDDDTTNMPYRMTPPRDIVLKRSSDAAKWNYNFMAQYDDTERHMLIFPSESAMESAVTQRFIATKPMSIKDEIKWLKHWPHLSSMVSKEAKDHIKAEKLEHIDAKIDRAIKRRDVAEGEATDLANERLAVERGDK